MHSLASTTVHRSTVSMPPRLPGALNTGLRRARWPSVRSLGYDMPATVPTVPAPAVGTHPLTHVDVVLPPEVEADATDDVGVGRVENCAGESATGLEGAHMPNEVSEVRLDRHSLRRRPVSTGVARGHTDVLDARHPGRVVGAVVLGPSGSNRNWSCTSSTGCTNPSGTERFSATRAARSVRRHRRAKSAASLDGTGSTSSPMRPSSCSRIRSMWPRCCRVSPSM